MLEIQFRSELANLSVPVSTIDRYWAEIVKAYTKKRRYYHNLNHLEELLSLLLPLKNEIGNWPAVVLAIAYHDIVYNILKKDNEDQSALFADQKLSAAGLDFQIRKLCGDHIRFTKAHQLSDNKDTNLFTDADLAILGAEADVYLNYASQIRKEYRYFPDIVYNPGRKKVLLHFLEMKSIYKTEYFRMKFEDRAKVNIQTELRSL